MSSAKPKGCAQWNPLDPTDCRDLERSTATLSFEPNLPPLVPDLCPAGTVQSDPDLTELGKELYQRGGIDEMERLFDWLFNLRKLSAWEYHADNLLGMSQLGCIVFLFRNFLDSLY